MKQTFVKTVSKRIIVAATILTALIFATANRAQAGNNNTTTITSIAKSDVEFAGTTDNTILFNVKYDNPSAGKFTFVIKNTDGDVVYSQTSNNKSFTKKIVVMKGAEDGQLTFIIKSAVTNYSKTFNINITSKVLEDVMVTATK